MDATMHFGLYPKPLSFPWLSLILDELPLI